MKKIIVPFSFLVLAACGNRPSHVLQGRTGQEEIAIAGKLAGRMERLLVEEGEQVKKGDTLAILHIPELEARKAQAAGAVESADAQYQMSVTGATRNQLAQLNAKRAALQEQHAFAARSVERLRHMVQDSLVPQQSFDEAFAKLQGAKAQLDAVNAEIADVRNGARAEQQAMALGQKNRALGAMQEVAVAEHERYIIAPDDMTISLVTLHQGELALPGYTLFKGNVPNSTYFRFTLPENELARIKEGQEVSVHVPYLGRDVPCTISRVQALPAYANIATAYPDYELQQSLFEFRAKPLDPATAGDIFPRTTVTMKL